MLERLLILVGGLSSKAFALLMTSTSAFFGVVLGEAATKSLIWSGIAGAFASTAAACFLVIPRVMEQRRKSRESAARLQSELLSKMTDLHKEEVGFYKMQVASAEMIATIERNAKHDVIQEWTSCREGYKILSTQLHVLGHTPEIELDLKSYEQLLGDADKEIKEIKNDRVKSITEKLEAQAAVTE